jgi:hypothetical protein
MQFLQASKDGAAGFTALAGQGAASTVPKSGDRMLTDLSMYTSPPSENISLEEFERLALARLSGQ